MHDIYFLFFSLFITTLISSLFITIIGLTMILDCGLQFLQVFNHQLQIFILFVNIIHDMNCQLFLSLLKTNANILNPVVQMWWISETIILLNLGILQCATLQLLTQVRQFIVSFLIISVTNNIKHLAGVTHMHHQILRQSFCYFHHHHARIWCIKFPFSLLLQILDFILFMIHWVGLWLNSSLYGL